MTLLDVDVGDAVEPKVMPAGEECKLRIVGASITTSDKGTFLIPRLEVTGEPYAKEFTHVLTIPEDDMDEKRTNQCKYRLDEFYRTFEFSPPAGGYEPEDALPGCEGWAILGIRESDEYGEQNTIRKFLPPK